MPSIDRELVNFLQLKRLFPDEAISPSPAVEALWRLLCLNDDEREAVSFHIVLILGIGFEL